jgi:polysaccharide export outer membrane protein
MNLIRYSIFLCLISLLCSCVNTQKVTYFHNIGDTVLVKQAEDMEPVIQKNDILTIAVSSLNPEASILFNVSNSSGAAGSSSGAGGYLVDEEGFLQFPMLGQVKAAGLSKKALAAYLTKQLKDRQLLLDPIISVRQANFHVTVLGEVGHPAVVSVPNERINIMEAIGFAGDLTLQSNRNNALLIREEGGKKITRRLNLNSSDMLTSPYYQLRSNDIVYVEPNKTKISSTSRGWQILPIVISTISFLFLVVDRIAK